MKTKITGYLLVILFISAPFFTTSCFRKGKDDPFMSMYTRKDRVVGNWEIAERTDTAKYSINEAPSETVYTKVNGLDWTETHVAENNEVHVYKGKVLKGSNTYSFTKDGRFKYSYSYEYDKEMGSEEEDNLEAFKVEIGQSASGTWNFLSKIDSYKNKERIALVIEERSYFSRTYKKEEDDDEGQNLTLIDNSSTQEKFANGEVSTIWRIMMLKRKEIVLHQDIDKWYTQSQNTTGENKRITGSSSITLKKIAK